MSSRQNCFAFLFAIVVIAAASSPAFAQRAPSAILHETLPIATKTNAYFLVANTPAQVTIPTDCEGAGKPCDAAIFAVTGGRFWLDDDADCEVPTATITDGSAPEPNPSARTVAGLASFCIVTDESDVVVYASFYRLRLP